MRCLAAVFLIACVSGSAKLAPGAACKVSSECASGFVCLDSRCTELACVTDDECGLGLICGSDLICREGTRTLVALTYSQNPAEYLINVAIQPNTASLIGGVPNSFSVTPALPAGLTFDERFGAITGTPTTVVPATAYAITAANSAGQASATLSIAVIEATPATTPVSPTLSTLLASPTGVLADGVGQITVTVTLKDPQDRPVVGRQLTLLSTRADTISAPVQTNPAGVALFAVVSTTAGTSTLSVDGVAQTATVTFNAAGAALSWQDSLNFAFAPTNHDSQHTFTLKNVGTLPTSSIGVSLAPSGPFGVTADQCSGQVLASNASCTVGLDFLAEVYHATAGVKSTNLSATAAMGGTAAMAIEATASYRWEAQTLCGPTGSPQDCYWVSAATGNATAPSGACGTRDVYNEVEAAYDPVGTQHYFDNDYGTNVFGCIGANYVFGSPQGPPLLRGCSLLTSYYAYSVTCCYLSPPSSDAGVTPYWGAYNCASPGQTYSACDVNQKHIRKVYWCR